MARCHTHSWAFPIPGQVKGYAPDGASMVALYRSGPRAQPARRHIYASWDNTARPWLVLEGAPQAPLAARMLMPVPPVVPSTAGRGANSDIGVRVQVLFIADADRKCPGKYQYRADRAPRYRR